MGQLSKLAGERIHTRTIEMSIFSVDDTHILSTGHFNDVRHFPSFDSAGRSYNAGTLHDLEVHVLLKIPELVIEDIEVSINMVPREDCHTLKHSLDPVIGLSISRGFTERVKSLAGGKTGCTHMVHLLSTMGPAILQGYWAFIDRQKQQTEAMVKRRAAYSARFLKNSCFTWREEGEAFKELLGVAGENDPRTPRGQSSEHENG